MNKYQFYKVWTLLLAQLFYMAGGTIYAQTVEPQNRKDWRVWLNKARTAYEAGDFQNALEFYKNASLGCPKEVNLAPELAQTYYRLKNNQEAETWYDQSGEDAKVAYNKGNIAFQEKKFSEAIEQYKKALKMDPELEKAKFNLNKALQMKNQQNPPPPPAPNKNASSPPKPNGKEDKPSEQRENKEQSGLSDRSIERLLDQLMKQESQTKRKVSSGKEEGGMRKSNKDW